jgi:hypothetical protein
MLSVKIVVRLYVGRPEDQCLIAGRARDFILSKFLRLISPPSNAEIKKFWSYTFTPPYLFIV